MAHNPAFLAIVNDAKSRIKETDMAGYKKMLEGAQKPVLVDVREESEWSAGHAAVYAPRRVLYAIDTDGNHSLFGKDLVLPYDAAAAAVAPCPA